MLDKRPERVARMFDGIARHYDVMNRLISAGQDQKWRRHLMENLPRAHGGLLCDVACGTGDLLELATRTRPDFGSFLGIDISAGMLAVARKRLLAQPRSGLDLKEASALALPLADASAEAVTIAFGIRNIEPRAGALAEFRRVLKPGGHLAVLEIVSPEKGMAGALFRLYFQRIMPRLATRIGAGSAYHYLPASVASMPTARAFRDEIVAAGFTLRHEKSWVFGAVGCFVFERPNHS